MALTRINWRSGGKDGGADLNRRFSLAVAAGTGLWPRTVGLWVIAEGGPVQNPLNIGPGRQYANIDSAALATIRVVQQSNMAVIRGSAGKSVRKQLEAIAASPWDAGHYGGDGSNLTRLDAEIPNPFDNKQDRGDASDALSGGPGVHPDSGANGPADAIAGGVKAVMSVADFLTLLADPHFWLRVLYVIGGMILLLAGLALLVRELAPGSVASKVGISPLTNAKALAGVVKK